MRTGVIARKMGMTRVFTEAGQHVPVTVLKVDGCQVVAVRTADKDGYTAVQLGAGKAKPKNTTQPMRGHFARGKVEPKRKLAEFRVSDDALLEPGAEVVASHFAAGQYVDISGTSIGRGFTGVVKRHGFRGIGETHGVSAVHRSAGSTGQMQDPGRVFKGKKMAGHYGDERVTTQNLQVVSTDDERGLILVRGAVPGSRGGWVLVRDAVKRRLPEGVPFPAGLRGAGESAPETGAAGETTEAAVDEGAAEDTPETAAGDEPAAEAESPDAGEEQKDQ